MRFIGNNVLLYSISRDPGESAKRTIAIALLENADLALRWAGDAPGALSHDIAVALLRTWLRFKVQEIPLPVLMGALEIKAGYGLAYWDAAIVAAARALGCRELFSEDMAHGREVEGIVVSNPFR